MKRSLPPKCGGFVLTEADVDEEVNPDENGVCVFDFLLNTCNLHNLTKSFEELIISLLLQLFDNAMMSAGLLHDPRSMVGRLNSLLAQVLDSSKSKSKQEPVTE